ncbi:MAG: hypothetical protein ACLPX5_04215 [Dissulfurispiraceae bacterium]
MHLLRGALDHAPVSLFQVLIYVEVHSPREYKLEPIDPILGYREDLHKETPQEEWELKKLLSVLPSPLLRDHREKDSVLLFNRSLGATNLRLDLTFTANQRIAKALPMPSKMQASYQIGFLTTSEISSE